MIYGYYKFTNDSEDMEYKKMLQSMGVPEKNIYTDKASEIEGLKNLFENIDENEILITKKMDDLIENEHLEDIIKLFNSKTLTVFFW